MSRVSRRALLSSGAAASIFAATGFAVGAAPRRGGTLRIAVGGPLGGQSGQDGMQGLGRAVVRMATHDCLTEIGPDGTLKGELATRWDASDGGRIWTFLLAQDAVFSNGTPLQVHDVIKSLVGVPGLGDIDAPNGSTVRLAFRTPVADAPFILADPRFSVSQNGDAALDAPGTGLFRISDTGGDHQRLIRVTGHRKDGRAGWFDAIEIRGAMAHEARLSALLEGRADVVDAVDPAIVDRLARKDRLKIDAVRGRGSLSLILGGSTDAEPLARQLRGTLEQARLADAVFRGYGSGESEIAQDLATYNAVTLPLVVAEHHMGEPVLLRLVAALRTMAADGGVSLQPTLRMPVSGPYAILSDSYGSPATSEPETNRVRIFADYICAYCARLRHLGRIGSSYPLDSARIAERWWFV